MFVMKKLMLCPHTYTCAPTGATTAAAIEYRICSCSTQPFLQHDFGTGWLLFVCVSQESSERNLFYMLRRNGFENSLKKMYRRVRKTCSALVALCGINGKVHGKMRHRYKVHILCYILHIVPFWYLFWILSYIYGDLTFRMPYVLNILHCCWII